jgi:hypothetical protein
MDWGSFFHAVYRIEAVLGRAMREVEPYPLFPFENCFGRRRHGREARFSKMLTMPTHCAAAA